MQKVNLKTLKPWIAARVTELLDGVGDEAVRTRRVAARQFATHLAPCYQVLIRLVNNMLSAAAFPSGRDMYAALLTFLKVRERTPLLLPTVCAGR